MSQLTQHPSYLMIEDQLDLIGQKYRGLRIVRGAILWAFAAIIASLAAAVIAGAAGAGKIAHLALYAWIGWMAASAVYWIVRPLLLHPRPVEVARLIESRIPNLHNGLTNSVLLAHTQDIKDSPWLSLIFDEILSTSRTAPLQSAVSVRDLNRPFVRLCAALLVALILFVIPASRYALQRGWQQMFNPAKFVAKIGKIRLIEVLPKEVTLVVGQPLEIRVLAEDPDKGLPTAHLVFENNLVKPADLTPVITPEDQLRYTYRLDHVDEALRFRVEVGDSESEWCTVNVVKQVKLQELVLQITPPTYTQRPAQTLTLKPDDIARSPVTVVEGSKVEMTVSIDVPVKSALMQLDQNEPAVMSTQPGGTRFAGTFIVMTGCDVAALFNENGQVIAKLPDPSLHINCTKDAAPQIEMKWPTQDTPVAPKAELKLSAILKDDIGLTNCRILMSTNPDAPLAPVFEQKIDGTVFQLAKVLDVPAEVRVHGKSIKVQVEATDNRSLASLLNGGPGAPTSSKDLGPQTTTSPIYEIKFRDPEEIAKEQKEQFDKLRQMLREMLEKQQALHSKAVAWKPGAETMPQINTGQTELRTMMVGTAETFQFDPEDKIVQKTLLVLAASPAREAIDISQAINTEKVAEEQVKQNKELQSRQRRIIDMLEAMLSRLNNPQAPTTQPSKKGSNLDNPLEKFKDLDEALKKFITEEKRILDATASLAKKPVDNYDTDDKKLLEELKQAQEKMDAFMQEKIADFSKLAEQDMANASLLKEMLEVYSEVTMAKDALKKEAVEMAIPAEEMGLEKAKEIESNLEKWLMNEPDRQKWNQEDPIGKTDLPMPELPKELEDMVGELLEQQEDLFDEMEDTAANWADSMDKGAGWDAADGPIANMTAKGVTGNQLPNNNEMNGRSGEGRQGKSSGEMVEETTSGKGGRNTPTRLDPTPFQQGQVKDESKDPTGGATGGGKIGGQAGQGLQGPVPPKDLSDKMERLKGKQAELRNKMEKLQLDRKAAPYDNFKLMEAIANMRRLESDIKSNRYNNAMRRKDIVLDKMAESRMMLSGQVHLQKDTSPQLSRKMEDEINDITNGQLPPAWSEALKEYYKKLSQ
ncbi:MAG: hypothetical protein ACHRHE_19860 [Tepidisphaerales bacterium]